MNNEADWVADKRRRTSSTPHKDQITNSWLFHQQHRHVTLSLPSILPFSLPSNHALFFRFLPSQSAPKGVLLFRHLQLLSPAMVPLLLKSPTTALHMEGSSSHWLPWLVRSLSFSLCTFRLLDFGLFVEWFGGSVCNWSV